MNKTSITKTKKAFSMMELTIAMVVVSIITLGIGVYFVDIQRGWGNMFQKVHGEVVTDAYISRKAFDGAVRQSSRLYAISPDSLTLKVIYWDDIANNTSVTPDRYALFYTSDNGLLVEHGTRNPDTEIRTETLAGNVNKCEFSRQGSAIKMTLELDDGEEKMDIVHSAVTHN